MNDKLDSRMKYGYDNKNILINKTDEGKSSGNRTIAERVYRG